jgi:hypothetical protein
MISEVNDVIAEKNIVILSPHYDDVPLTFGGYLDAMVTNNFIGTRNIHIVQIFSRSNYQARDDMGNRDLSNKRVGYATGIRLLEDLNCLDELIGHGNYTYELMAENECLLRNKGLEPGEAFEFPRGTRADFNEVDHQILNRIRQRIHHWLPVEETALLIPLGVKEHIDHIVLREAVMEARKELDGDVKATLYFGEDQPYAGLADVKDWTIAEAFLEGIPVDSISYCMDDERKSDLIMKHYTSQVEESYREGVLNRSARLRKESGSESGVERMYRLKS